MKRLAPESITNFRIVLFITVKNGLKDFIERITVLRYVQLGKDRLDYSRDEWYRTIALILDDTLTNEWIHNHQGRKILCGSSLDEL